VLRIERAEDEERERMREAGERERMGSLEGQGKERKIE